MVNGSLNRYLRKAGGCPQAPPCNTAHRAERRQGAQPKRRSLKLMVCFQSSTLPTRLMLAQVPL